MSKLNNFKGKKHTFTSEERAKGGKKKTDKKLFSCQTNPIKDKTINTLKDCNFCNIFGCPFEEEGLSCRLFNTKFVRLVMFHRNLSSVEEFDAYMFNFFRRGSMMKREQSSAEMKDFLYELLDIQEWKHESLR